LAFGERAGEVRRPASIFRRLRKTLGEVFYGMTGYELEREAARVRADLENLFLFLVAGDLLGVPILPPYYSLRLLPYFLETLPYWRRRVLRERNPFEDEEFDLHGL
jgi:hypothetical protein